MADLLDRLKTALADRYAIEKRPSCRYRLVIRSHIRDEGRNLVREGREPEKFDRSRYCPAYRNVRPGILGESRVGSNVLSQGPCSER